jgi:hypothetical protein
MPEITKISSQCPYIAPVALPVESKAHEGLLSKDSPFEEILRTVFQSVALCEEDALKLRSLSLEKEQEWRQFLYQRLGEEGIAAAKRNNQSRFVNTIWHILEPLPMIGMGVATVVSGGTVGAVALAVTGIVVGALMAIDAIFDDSGKKAIASLLTDGGEEETQAIVGRMYFLTTAVSIACSFGLSGTELVKAVTQTLSAASEVTFGGVKIFTDRRANTQMALVKELDVELRECGIKITGDMADLRERNEIIHAMLAMMEATMKSHQDATSKICSSYT